MVDFWFWCYKHIPSISINFLRAMAGLGCTMSISTNKILWTSWSQQLPKPLMDHLRNDQALTKKTQITSFIVFHQHFIIHPIKRYNKNPFKMTSPFAFPFVFNMYLLTKNPWHFHHSIIPSGCVPVSRTEVAKATWIWERRIHGTMVSIGSFP